MPITDWTVCDSDMHVMEPPDLWQRYIAAEFKHAAPVGMTELRRDIRVRVKSEILLRTGPVRPLKERGGSGIGWREDQEAAYAVEMFQTLPLSEAAQRKIVGANWSRLYNLPLPRK